MEDRGDARTARGAVSRAAGTRFAVEKPEMRQPKGSEVVVQLEAVAMCHADLAARDGEFPALGEWRPLGQR